MKIYQFKNEYTYLKMMFEVMVDQFQFPRDI
jgi:hypothetical protein